MLNVELVIDKDNSVRLPGIDLGAKVELTQRNDKYLVIKIPGHLFWVGLFMPWKYAPVEYKVFKILSTDSKTSLQVDEIISFDVRRKK